MATPKIGQLAIITINSRHFRPKIYNTGLNQFGNQIHYGEIDWNQNCWFKEDDIVLYLGSYKPKKTTIRYCLCVSYCNPSKQGHYVIRKDCLEKINL